MVASQARIEANRKNSARSTGPKTVEGKERSRANALVHGLCSMTVVVEPRDLVEARTLGFVEALKPGDEFERWMVGQAAVLSVRIDRCQKMEGCARDKLAIRAELTWDDDRRLDAHRVARKLAEEPDYVVEQLRRTPQGCDWLIGRWALLAHAARSNRGWTSEQVGVALDLLGTPVGFREGQGAPGDPADLARRSIAELEGRRDLVAGFDEVDQALAEADLDDETSPELKRLRRYESALQRQLRWHLDRLPKAPKPEESPTLQPEPVSVLGQLVLDDSPISGPVPASPTASEPVRSSSPMLPGSRLAKIDLPFGIRPTLDQFVEVVEGPPGRADRSLRKAEGRREAKRRKRERLRS